MIVSMGFTEKQAERALRKCDGNIERACDWIFSHMDEPPSDEEAEPMAVDQDNSQHVTSNAFENKSPESGAYQFSSFVTHLGSSVHAGHYVCHIRKGQDWIYFNDAKVAQCPEPPFEKGYIYVFSKK
jgi:ubiquitin carboxyl-terminal hydrolase 5/13